MWVRAVGCSNTVVKQMFDIFNIDIPEGLAGAMACAILSDTVIFKSPNLQKRILRRVESWQRLPVLRM